MHESPSRRRTILAIAISAVVHVLLFAVLFAWAPDRSIAPEKDKVALEIVDRASPADFEKAPLVSGPVPRREDDRLDGQVVTLPEPEVQKVPDTHRFLSKYDISVDREQVSRRSPGTPGRKVAKPKTERAGNNAAEGQVERGSEAQAQGDAVKDREPGRITLPSIRGLGNMLLPGGAAGGRGSGLNMRMLADEMLADGSLSGGPEGTIPSGTGGGGSDDVFMGVEDEGDVTLVNSRSFKYWDFFDRIKGQVRSEWDPGPVYRARDPEGNAFGRRDRYTILGVVLDRSGAVAQLDIVHRSGLDFLDEEAVRAFQAAGPFPNPPAGLIDESGRIIFRFGFLLEFGSSTGSFFWQRP